MSRAPSTRRSPGTLEVYLTAAVFPKGSMDSKSLPCLRELTYFDANDAYFWKYVVDTRCKGYIPMPTGREFFGISPLAVPVTGADPEQIIPLSLGHYAVGGELLIMGVEFCPFDEHVDTHFGIYCPEDDPLNYLFCERAGSGREESFSEGFMMRLTFFGEIAREALLGDRYQFDTDQEDQTNLFYI